MNPKEAALALLVGSAALAGCGEPSYPIIGSGVNLVDNRATLDQLSSSVTGRGTLPGGRVFVSHLSGLRVYRTLECDQEGGNRDTTNAAMEVELDVGNLTDNKKVALMVTVGKEDSSQNGIIYIGDSQEMHLFLRDKVSSIEVKLIDGPSSGEELQFKSGMSITYELVEVIKLDKNGLKAQPYPFSSISLGSMRCSH